MKFWSKTTAGLIKTTNEDFMDHKDGIFCLCDGHWGTAAAQLTCKTILASFPSTKSQAITLLNQVERELSQIHKSECPPETSVVALQINKKHAKVLSYGDCRLLQVRKNKIIFKNKIVPTWLGPLSLNATRGRLRVKSALMFCAITLKPNDRIMMFTDGVDECVYEQPTIDHHWIATHSPSQIFRRVFVQGAEDNASLINITC